MPPNSAILIVAVFAMLMGLIMALSQQENKPIPRSEAVAYTGKFEEYEAGRNYRTIHFADGSTYDVYPHTETRDFRERMESLEKGTTLHLLINPNNKYVAEIRTDTRELLNFDTSQAEIAAYDNGYVAIGLFACGAGIFLILYVIGTTRYARREKARQETRASARMEGQDDPILRRADESAKCRILLEAVRQEYRICYRRLKHTNELVVNGYVYDEKKGIIEFTHKLSAVVDGHIIEAGYDDRDFSYIRFDGKRIARKKRIL